MASYKQVAFTSLELKGVMLRAEIGCRTPCTEIDRDAALAAAAESGLEKLHRAHLGLGRKATPPKHPKRGADLDLRHRSADGPPLAPDTVLATRQLRAGEREERTG